MAKYQSELAVTFLHCGVTLTTQRVLDIVSEAAIDNALVEMRDRIIQLLKEGFYPGLEEE